MSAPELLHAEIESLPLTDMQALQDTKWTQQWDYLRQRSDFYKRKFGSAVTCEMSLDDLNDLPLTDKEDLRESQERDYPFGDYVACRPDQIIRIHRTSGTTGKALILANSKHDAEIIALQGARGMYASGLRPGDRVVHCLNYCLWTGGVTDHLTLEATGATVIPYGVGNTKGLIEAIIDLGVTAISCTPSYPALLEKVLREDFNKRPKELGLRLGLFGGEAGLDNPQFRQSMEETWGFGVRNANFGLSEVMSTMGSQCEHTTDLHFLSSDAVFVELLNPATGQRVDITDGASGELVCTHLEKQCQPLVRYRTRDILTVADAGPCACGRTSWRFRVTGRTDDMFNVRGINVFPSAIQKVMTGNLAMTSGHFRILLDGPGPYDRIRIKAEVPEGMPAARWGEAARALETAVRETVGATSAVNMVPFGSLPRTDGKTNYIERTK